MRQLAPTDPRRVACFAVARAAVAYSAMSRSINQDEAPSEMALARLAASRSAMFEAWRTYNALSGTYDA